MSRGSASVSKQRPPTGNASQGLSAAVARGPSTPRQHRLPDGQSLHQHFPSGGQDFLVTAPGLSPSYPTILPPSSPCTGARPKSQSAGFPCPHLPHLSVFSVKSPTQNFVFLTSPWHVLPRAPTDKVPTISVQ